MGIAAVGAALIAMGMLILAGADSCPGLVRSGGAWPASRPMHSQFSGTNRACCMFPWVEASDFGTVEQLQAAGAPTTGLYCLDATTLEEFVSQTTEPSLCSECGPYITPDLCAVVSNVCGQWGPSVVGAPCCRAYDNNAEQFTPEQIAHFKVPWLPITMCPETTGSGTQLVAYDLGSSDATNSPMSSLSCPESLTPLGKEQEIKVPNVFVEHIENGEVYALSFFRKALLTQGEITFEVVDASGKFVINETSVSFSDGDSRRHLLKASGGGSSSSSSGGGRSTTTTSNNPAWGTDASGEADVGIYGGDVTNEQLDAAFTSTEKEFALVSGVGFRFVNDDSFIIPFHDDYGFEKGELLAATSGGGLSYWGFLESGESSAHYGLPHNFNSTWYTSVRETDYGYSGDSLWGKDFPVMTWGQPFSCSADDCVYRSAQPHYEDHPSQELRHNYLSCHMKLDIVMDSAFIAGEYDMPLTVSIKSASAKVTDTPGACGDVPQDESTVSTPGNEALYAALIKVSKLKTEPRPSFNVSDEGFNAYFQSSGRMSAPGGLPVLQAALLLIVLVATAQLHALN